MNVVARVDGYRRMLARIHRRQRKGKLDFRRRLHSVTSSLCLNEIGQLLLNFVYIYVNL
jgi:hypothetical protein